MTCPTGPGVTHHAGCACHEERHAAEIARLTAELAHLTQRLDIQGQDRARLALEVDRLTSELANVRTCHTETGRLLESATKDNARLAERLATVRAAVIDCAYCNGVGALVRLPGDVIEACPACGGLRAALDASKQEPSQQKESPRG